MISIQQYIIERFDPWNPGINYPKAHKKVLDEMFKGITPKNILDVGIGKTSLGYLTAKFSDAEITGITMPGDKRKIDPVKQWVKSKNYTIIEKDLVKFKPLKPYDVVLAHMFITEVPRWTESGRKSGKVSRDLSPVLSSLLSLPTKRLIVIDGYDDPDVDWDEIINKIKSRGWKISKQKLFKMPPGKMYKQMIGMVLT